MLATAGSSTTAHAAPPGVSQAAEQALKFELSGLHAYAGLIAKARRVNTYGLVDNAAAADIDRLRVEAADELAERLDDLATPLVDDSRIRDKMVDGGRGCLAGAMDSTAQHLGRALQDEDTHYDGVTPLHEAVSKCVRVHLSGASGSDVSPLAGSIVNFFGGYLDDTGDAATGADATHQLVAQQRWIEETARTLRATDPGPEPVPTPPVTPDDPFVDRFFGSSVPWLICGALVVLALMLGWRRWYVP